MIKSGSQGASTLITLLSPLGLLLLVGFSYAWLCFSLEFALPEIKYHLIILGVVTLLFGYSVVRYSFVPIKLSHDFAARLLTSTICIQIFLAVLLMYVTGGSVNALLDGRFAIPAYGLVYGLYFVCGVVAAATWGQVISKCKKYIFIILFLYVGLIAGGKGFFLPFLFGLILATLLGLNFIQLRWLIVLTFAVCLGAVYVVFNAVENVELVWLIIENRLILAADAVQWLSKMSLADIVSFQVSAWQVILDLFSRWVGLRATALAVGSAIAIAVSGDDGGGGPNPLLPVMAYLVTHGNFAFSIIFIILMLFLLKSFLLISNYFLSKSREGMFYFAVLKFLTPLYLIDVFLYWQTVVCLTVIGALCLFMKLMTKDCIQKRVIQS